MRIILDYMPGGVLAQVERPPEEGVLHEPERMVFGEAQRLNTWLTLQWNPAKPEDTAIKASIDQKALDELVAGLDAPERPGLPKPKKQKGIIHNS